MQRPFKAEFYESLKAYRRAPNKPVWVKTIQAESAMHAHMLAREHANKRGERGGYTVVNRVKEANDAQ